MENLKYKQYWTKVSDKFDPLKGQSQHDEVVEEILSHNIKDVKYGKSKVFIEDPVAFVELVKHEEGIECQMEVVKTIEDLIED